MPNLHRSQPYEPWNKGKLIGQKIPLQLKDIWAIRISLQLGHKFLDFALFNLAIDSKLRACDSMKLRAADVSHGEQMASRVMVMQQKTGRPVQFEVTPPLARLCIPGSSMPGSKHQASYSPAVYRSRHICRPDNMQGLSTDE
ncbi:hypothetical protein [Dokdonella sp.]|uniref:hypothetical protein n=1 Tax=Dokdonella sp. TaxID=2291710 RepID=UPI0025BBDABD|nr:hypothetical protein [Dokdonella sp.]